MSSVDPSTDVIATKLALTKLSLVFSSCVNDRRRKTWSIWYKMKPVVGIVVAHGTRFVLIGRRSL